MTSTLKHISHNQKLEIPSFDLDPIASGCATRCKYGIKPELINKPHRLKNVICYALNNPNERYPSRIDKLKENLKLIKSAKFVQTMRTQIMTTRSRQFRFFSSGDLPNYTSLTKIVKLAKLLPKVEIWLSTSRDDYLYKFLVEKKQTKPHNLKIRLSHDDPLIPFAEPEKQFWLNHGVFVSSTTLDATKANCPASKDGLSCGTCEKCFTDPEVIYLIHGQKARKNAQALKK